MLLNVHQNLCVSRTLPIVIAYITPDHELDLEKVSRVKDWIKRRSGRRYTPTFLHLTPDMKSWIKCDSHCSDCTDFINYFNNYFIQLSLCGMISAVWQNSALSI